MKKLICILSVIFKSLLILWVPILLIEETFLLNFIGVNGSLIVSVIASILCLILYIKTYKKMVKEKINCYFYNIINTILLIISNLVLGYFFLYLMELNIFHQCMGSGWDCFLFGIEYMLIGLEYAFFSVVILVIWLLIRFVKFLYNKLKKKG